MGMDIGRPGGWCGGVVVIDESGPVVVEKGRRRGGGTVEGDEGRGEARRGEATRGARRLLSTVGDLTMVRGRRCDDAMGRGRVDARVGSVRGGRGETGSEPSRARVGCVGRACRGWIDRPRGVDVARWGA